MENLYTNDSGHEMADEDFKPYLAFKRNELTEAGQTETEIKEFINSFLDDCR